MINSVTRTVVFVHGAWMVPASWDKFRSAYEAAGFTTLAPAWPYLEGKATDLRQSVDPRFGKMSLNQIVDHYAAIIRGLDEAPLLVGHSFGGLIVQLLLDRGLGVAGIALDPGPVAGALPDFLSLGAALPILTRWNAWNRPYLLSLDGFKARFANGAPTQLQEREYDRLVVPAPGMIFLQAATMIGTGVKPLARKQPLLITGADRDRTVSPVLARRIYDVQKKSPARTDFKLFANHSHFLAGEPGWEEVAQYTIDWANSALAVGTAQ